MAAALPAPVRSLLAAIAETLDVPAPAPGRDAEVAYRLLVEDRARVVRVILHGILTGDETRDIDWDARYLRERAAERPVTYRTLDQALDGNDGQS
ncbi:hypothetical protein [Streptomyces pacificus]|uniref:Uncharacterized protein n=1 Tax=Streptomyces pacificus TaxID=2705029 RepID=A0A6A0ARW7_9ACTN|nr:hypothetical protein [Streptomyces pacificus]GFH34317.1 hypothetical protein SCWH03_05310 [Streptomyces pacificus]